jgi:hypothetical protein
LTWRSPQSGALPNTSRAVGKTSWARCPRPHWPCAEKRFVNPCGGESRRSIRSRRRPVCLWTQPVGLSGSCLGRDGRNDRQRDRGHGWSSAVARPLGEAVWLRKGCRSSARQRAWKSRLTHKGVRRQVGIARWRIAVRRSTAAEDGPDSRPQNPITGTPPMRLGAASALVPPHGGLPRLLGMLFLSTRRSLGCGGSEGRPTGRC